MSENIINKKCAEDAFKQYFAGDVLKNALEFLDLIFECGISEIDDNNSGTWHFLYLGRVLFGMSHAMVTVGDIHIWWIDNDLSEPEMMQMNEQLKEFVVAHISHCGKCGGTSGETKGCGKRETILGKEYDVVCHSILFFHKPDIEGLEKLVKLIEIRKQIIERKSGG